MTRLAVLGGPLGNPHALRAVLADARDRGCERTFCLGDLGGFGDEPDAVWPLLDGVECIAGDDDVAIGRGDTGRGCGYCDERDRRHAQLLHDFARAATTPGFAAWMRELPLEHRETIGGVDVHMVHGSPLAIDDRLWRSLGDDEIRLRVEASGADVLLCAHTGIPWEARVGGTLVVNVGSAGRPANDGRTDVWYAVVDLEDGEARAQLVPVAYDWRAQAAAMRAASVPAAFVETIETGWWTTCLEVVPPRERSRGRFHVYREAVAGCCGQTAVACADAPGSHVDDRPVVDLFGTPAFPPRLWIYTNFHCNLACKYCVVASSPRAQRRAIGLERVRELVDEAAGEGFREIYLTGGEPFLEPEIVAMLEYASDRLPTVVLTNAMVFTGRRRRELAGLRARPNLVIQTSVDGARASTHDAWRGEGSWARTMQGIAFARELDLPLRVAMTQTPDNRGEADELRAILAELGVRAEDFAVRPLVRRGFAADETAGIEVDTATLAPELTVTAEGVHWHPIGGDLQSSPDLLVASGRPSLGLAKRLVVERVLALRLAGGTLPGAFRCAV